MYNMFEEFKNEQEIIDRFIKGEISPNDFLLQYDANDKLPEWIEINNKKAKEINSFWNKISKEDSFKFFENVRTEYEIYFEADVYNYIYRLFYSFNDELVASKKWTARSSLLIECVPEYLDGDIKTIEYIDKNVFSNLADNISASKKIKLCKEEIKKAFYIEGNKYPHWIQSSEWPLSKTGKPTKYLRTENRHGGEVKAYIFLDVDTNEEITVEQCY